MVGGGGEFPLKIFISERECFGFFGKFQVQGTNREGSSEQPIWNESETDSFLYPSGWTVSQLRVVLVYS